MLKTRITWLDVLKFIGIFEIWLGHFALSAGKGYLFAYSHHVELFFFVAGCSHIFAKNLDLQSTFISKFKNLLIPFFIFATVSVLIETLQQDYFINDVIKVGISVLKGCIRNSFFASALWFLTALFVTYILFSLISKFSNKIKLLISIIIYIIFYLFIYDKYSFMIFNIDSGIRYLLFFVIGYVSFEKLNNFLNSGNKILLFLTAISAIGYSVLLFLGKDLFEILFNIPNINLVLSVVRPLIVIFAFSCIAKIFDDVKLLQNIGKNTLYLCGSEYIIKISVPIALSIVGLNISLVNPLAVYIYTFILLLLANKFIVPVLKALHNKLVFF